MKHLFKDSKNTVVNFVLILFLSVSGFLLFQSQDFKPLSGDNDFRFDQPTHKYLTTFTPPHNEGQIDVITSSDGYDNFDISVDYAEQSLVANPMNPLQMFFGVNASPMSHRYTTNAGVNWALSSLSYPPSTCCDPWTATDSLGNLYYSVLSSANFVGKSTNFGVSFGTFVTASPGGDRNSIAVDYTSGPYAGYIYATAWSPNCSFSRSTNGGTSFTTILSGIPNTTPGNMICIGPSQNGTVQGGSVYWVTITGTNPAPSTFNFYRSTDGGATMNSVSSSAISPGYVGTLNSASRLVINNARTRPYPMIACDNSYGPYRGRVYCVYASNTPAGNGNKPDIKLQYSTDGAATWSTPIVVNDDANTTTSDQWFPAVWCDKNTGKLYIKWYDTRNAPSTYGVDVYATYSTTGGTSFAPNQKITNATWTYPCPACSPNTNCYMGDYDAITANKKVGFMVWYDGRSCNMATFGAYFPDYAMKLNKSVDSINGVNGHNYYRMIVPSVKLYTDTVIVSATVTPTPTAGTISFSYANNKLTHFPDSLVFGINATGGVTNGTYTVTVQANGPNGTPVHRRNITLIVSNIVSGIPTTSETPTKYSLSQNYPNPFNPTTNIEFALMKASNVKMSIFDITGKQLLAVDLGKYDAGKFNYKFDGSLLSSGIYFYRLEAGDFKDTKAMILVK